MGEKQYSIHQIAELLGISADAIRLYEKEGMVKPVRSDNGYRWYGVTQIHRIMGISLYRQLGVGLSEIRRLFQVEDFAGLSEEFGALIESNEKDIEMLRQKVQKLRFMRDHIQELNRGMGNYSIRTLPGRYEIFKNDTGRTDYREMKEILSRPVFSFGNMCYHIDCGDRGHCRSDSLQFVIREPMMDICPLSPERDRFPRQPESTCIYTVCSLPELEHPSWRFEELYEYAAESGIQCKDEAYAFYVYSLVNENDIMDFYEIYVPVV